MARSLYTCTFTLCALGASAQHTLRGTITDPDGLPLPQVAVGVGDVGYGCVTDEQGAFQLEGVRGGRARLRATRVGHAPLDTLLDVPSAATLVLRMPALANTLREAEVSALRAGEGSPFATGTVDRERIQRTNTAVDIPVLLDQLPSVITTTDAGTGIGYTGMRVRGSDATRINVTVNGVPINDAESQAVFWVNMPDLASSAGDIEVQRGVGTSTNGPGAFGASINMRTTQVAERAFGELGAVLGSYDTQRWTARFGTGLLPAKEGGSRFSMDGRLSTISSNGYIDRATADLASYFVQGAWMGRTRSLRFITFGGRERTYQAWNGVPREVLDTNRTYNEYTYADQVDDYRQTHYQLLLEQRFGADATLSITAFRVLGAGFFEQYREEDDMAFYGIAPAVINGDTITATDLVRRRWLDNTLDGVNAAFERRIGPHRWVVGGSYSVYRGDHFGEVIWARYTGELDKDARYYANDSRKTDGNAYAKLTYALGPRIELFGDAQVRSVSHYFLGFDGDLRNVTQSVAFTFFNPKAGLSWRMDERYRVYASAAIANREPNRDDLTETSPESRPTSERMLDIEAGLERRTARLIAGMNAYWMDYRDQLVLTGELNDVGYALRTNVPRSYRAGVELTLAAQLTRALSWRANATFSRNKVRDLTTYVDDFDDGGQRPIALGETDLAFSPSAIAGSEMGWRFWGKAGRGSAEVTLVTKYVGRQFLDNSASPDRAIDPYLVNDLRFNAELTALRGLKRVQLNITLRNLFSEQYENNGWVYSYFSGGTRTDLVNLFPQAPLNILAGLTVHF